MLFCHIAHLDHTRYIRMLVQYRLDEFPILLLISPSNRSSLWCGMTALWWSRNYQEEGP